MVKFKLTRAIKVKGYSRKAHGVKGHHVKGHNIKGHNVGGYTKIFKYKAKKKK